MITRVLLAGAVAVLTVAAAVVAYDRPHRYVLLLFALAMAGVTHTASAAEPTLVLEAKIPSVPS